MSAPKLELRSLLTKNTLPGNGNPLERGQGTPFTFYWCRDSHEMYFTDAHGNFVNFGSLLASVLDGSTPVAFPATGCAGRDGAQGLKGDRGQTGPAGRDGQHGKDSTSVGPAGRDGVSIVGPQGERGLTGAAGRDGRDGRDCICKNGRDGKDGSVIFPTESEIAQALIELRSKYAKVQAALLLEISKAEKLHHGTRLQVLNTLKKVQKEIL